MQYALLIYEDEKLWETTPAEEAGAIMKGYERFGEALAKADAMRGGERLKPSTLATTVRIREGETLLTDGPFAETKEHFGGFYLIEAANIDEAVKWAAQIPGAQTGCVEIRPIWPLDEMDA